MEIDVEQLRKYLDMVIDDCPHHYGIAKSRGCWLGKECLDCWVKACEKYLETTPKEEQHGN